MNELALFAGSGGGILGGLMLGWRTICAVELYPYARAVLVARQNDGSLRPFPIWDDVRTFDGRPWRGRVDVISGGFPCQDISTAGKKDGIEGSRSGLWSEMARIVREVRPRYVFVENSPALTIRGLGVVLGDLAALGYDAAWDVFGARHAGAPHRRNRIWILASDTYRTALRDNKQRQTLRRDEIQNRRNAEPCDDGPEGMVANTVRLGLENNHEARAEEEAARVSRHDSHQEVVADPNRRGCRLLGEEAIQPGLKRESRHKPHRCGEWWAEDPAEREAECYVGRVVDGDADGLDRCPRLRCIGNAQVPAVAALAWNLLFRRLTQEES